MAVTDTYFPIDRLPHYAGGEFKKARLLASAGSGGTVQITEGSGYVESVTVGVVGSGTTLALHDADSATAAAAANLVQTIDISAVGHIDVKAAFSRGIKAVLTTTGATDLSIAFKGRDSVSQRTFGPLN